MRRNSRSKQKRGRLSTARRQMRRRRRLITERLEDRCLLAVFTVQNTADAGSGSLRDAILQANATAITSRIANAFGFAVANACKRRRPDGCDFTCNRHDIMPLSVPHFPVSSPACASDQVAANPRSTSTSRALSWGRSRPISRNEPDDLTCEAQQARSAKVLDLLQEARPLAAVGRCNLRGLNSRATRVGLILLASRESATGASQPPRNSA